MTTSTALPPVFAEVIGQEHAVTILARAARDAASARAGAGPASMTHAWLLSIAKWF